MSPHLAASLLCFAAAVATFLVLEVARHVQYRRHRGSGFVPGTHLRRVHETDVGRYVHVAGEQQWAGPAGSVLLFHQGMWHRGMPNPSGTDRLMLVTVSG